MKRRGGVRLEGTVRNVCAGRVRELQGKDGGRTIKTALVKTPLDGRVPVGRFGLPGDEHAYGGHDSIDQALLAYPVEHYDFWRDQGLEMPEAGAFGENLTVSGLVEPDVHLGDVFELGTAEVQVTMPRTPCYKLALRFGRKDMSVQVQDTGYTGYLLRVLTEGDVAAGDKMALTCRDRHHNISVAEAGQIINVDRNNGEGTRRVLAVESLAGTARSELEARLARQAKLGLDTDRLYPPTP